MSHHIRLKYLTSALNTAVSLYVPVPIVRTLTWPTKYSSPPSKMTVSGQLLVFGPRHCTCAYTSVSKVL